jgi:hypothetical protein
MCNPNLQTKSCIDSAHEPYRDVKSHSFENLNALCYNFHARYDKGDEIDRKSMKLYEAKLSIINSKYGDLEKRLLLYFANHPEISEVSFTASKENEIRLMYAVRDGLIRWVREVDTPGGGFTRASKYAYYEIRPEGKDFIKKWLDPEEEIQ